MASDSTVNACDPKYQTELPPLDQRSDYISDPTNLRAQSGHCYPNLFTMGLPLPLGPGIISGELLPGLVTTDPWSDEDKCNFIVGLHIFGTNFTGIKRFLENKKMVDILSYFYGEFCSSAEYIQWSECRKEKKKEKRKKMKTKKGKEMKKTYVELNEVFSGIRHRELISRLVSGVSGEIPILQVFKTFPYRETTVLDYVLFLKDLVGIKNLVEAIAIGKGEKDLTRTAFGQPRSKKVTTARQRIPTGETSKIVMFLQGGCRLSKAQSVDLFWEAVWPRLIRRGWNSEQIDDNGPENSMIFLVPGINKFSKTEHVKGVHYFDSVKHLLQRVAEEPGLIRSDEEKAECEPNDDRNDRQREGKQKQVGPVDSEAPIRKRRRRLTTGNHDEPRDKGIGCSTGPGSDTRPSCHNPARVKSPLAGPSNGSPRRDPVGHARPTEPSRGAYLFDLNSLPQASEESEQDNEPIMPDNNNGARNDDLVVVDTNPLRHSTRIRPQTLKGKSYGDSMAKNRKRKR